MKDEDVRIGMRVVPHNKTEGVKLNSCRCWMNAEAKDQPYLFVIKRCGWDIWALNDDKNAMYGNYYYASDFEPYKEPTDTLREENERLKAENETLRVANNFLSDVHERDWEIREVVQHRSDQGSERMTDKLKPCPFCGRFGHEANDQYATGGEYCECEACGIVLKGGAKVWNRRPIEDALRAELAGLKCQMRGAPASEQQPADGVNVLAWNCMAEEWGIGNHDASIMQWLINGVYYHGEKYDWITFWLPLPKPPEVIR